MFGRLLRHNSPQESNLGEPSQNGNRHLIYLRDVVKTYESAAGSFTALRGVNLQVETGEFIAVVGKSGSGKTTLVNMIAGIDRPTSGEILVGGTAVQKLSEGQMAVWRGRNVGVIFQFFQLLPTLSSIENVMLPMDFANMYQPHQRREKAMHLLELVEMADQADKLPATLSGGQQQRVLIARALVRRPDLLLLDEPVAGVDLPSQTVFSKTVANLVAAGTTILVVLHELGALEPLVQRAVVLRHGAVVHDGAPPPPQREHAGAEHVHLHPHDGDAEPAEPAAIAPSVRWRP